MILFSMLLSSNCYFVILSLFESICVCSTESDSTSTCLRSSAYCRSFIPIIPPSMILRWKWLIGDFSRSLGSLTSEDLGAVDDFWF